MNSDLQTILALRKVLESASEGMGMAQSAARELAGIQPLGKESARLVLLGFPLAVALGPLEHSGAEEVSMLASLVVSAPRSSATVIGKSGGVLASTLERWVKMKESGKMQQKALRFRSLVTCGVLGAVTAMIASLGPVVGSLDFMAAGPIGGSVNLLFAAAGLTGLSSCMLGLFMSGRGFYANVAVSLGVFTAVSILASPLASVPAVNLWGVK
jgi:hypothetical protein